jgi:hypothetical protein
MSAIDRIKETITEALMNSRGWDELSKQRNSVEWDPSREDSQYTLIKEDVDFVIDEFVEHIEELEISHEELDYDEPEIATETVTSSACMFIFMDAGIGNPRYISDVREWLSRVDELGVPDDTEIEGTLHMSYDIVEPIIERIECIECGVKDVLLTVHVCNETPKG